MPGAINTGSWYQLILRRTGAGEKPASPIHWFQVCSSTQGLKHTFSVKYIQFETRISLAVSGKYIPTPLGFSVLNKEKEIKTITSVQYKCFCPVTVVSVKNIDC